MKLKKEEYFELSYCQSLLENQQVRVEEQSKVQENYALKKRIIDLEVALLGQKIGLMKQKRKNAEMNLAEVRQRIAKRLGLDSIDSYILDTNTLELINETDI